MKFLYFNADLVLLLFLLFIFIRKNFAQHIIFSYPYDKAEKNILFTYKAMFQKINREVFGENADFEFSIELNETDSINATMEFTKVMTNLIDIYTNLHKHILVFAPYYPILLFDFNITYYSGNEIIQYTAFLNYQIFYLLIEENLNKDAEKNSINLTVYIKDKPKYRFIYEDTIPFEVEQAINNYFNSEFGNKYFPQFTELLKMYLDRTYKLVYESYKPFAITTAPFLFEKPMSIELSTFTYFSQDITGKRERVLFYYSGNVGDVIDYNSFNDHSDCKFFIQNLGTLYKDKLQIFFNYQIITEILQNFQQEHTVFMLNSTNKPFKDIKMNVAYLRTFVDQIGFIYSSYTEFYINSTIKEVILVKNTNGIVVLESNIYINDTDLILTFNSTLELSINYTVTYSAINLCIRPNIITLDFITARFKILELDKFQDEVKSWIMALFEGKEKCIFKNDINLFAYVKFIEFKFAGKKGLFIIGEVRE